MYVDGFSRNQKSHSRGGSEPYISPIRFNGTIFFHPFHPFDSTAHFIFHPRIHLGEEMDNWICTYIRKRDNSHISFCKGWRLKNCKQLLASIWALPGMTLMEQLQWVHFIPAMMSLILCNPPHLSLSVSLSLLTIVVGSFIVKYRSTSLSSSSSLSLTLSMSLS